MSRSRVGGKIGEELGGVEGGKNYNLDILCMKNIFSVKWKVKKLNR